MSSLFAWGSNKFSQLGFGTKDDQAWPKKIATVNFEVKSVAVAPKFTLALSATGELYSWGNGLTGELGLGYPVDAPTPTKITKLPNGVKFKAIDVGFEHCLALGEDGYVYSWGGNDLGQLGHGNTRPLDRPTKVKADGQKFVCVAAGGKTSMAISETGFLYVWGGGWAAQLGDGEQKNYSSPKKLETDLNWKDVKVGENYTVGINSRGKMYSWGSGSHGRLGHGDTKPQLKPKLIELFSKLDHKFVDVAVGYDHTIARTDKGLLFSFGAGVNGELGLGRTNRAKLPTLVPGSDQIKFQSVGVGYQYSIGLSESGDIYCWGNTRNGRLGNGKIEGIQTTPFKLDTDIKFSKIFVGKDHVVAIGVGEERPPKDAIINNNTEPSTTTSTNEQPAAVQENTTTNNNTESTTKADEKNE